jgi:hypothetical protein
VPVIAEVVGGHKGGLDDFKSGVESIIRLCPESGLSRGLRAWRATSSGEPKLKNQVTWR